MKCRALDAKHYARLPLVSLGPTRQIEHGVHCYGAVAVFLSLLGKGHVTWSHSFLLKNGKRIVQGHLMHRGQGLCTVHCLYAKDMRFAIFVLIFFSLIIKNHP